MFNVRLHNVEPRYLGCPPNGLKCVDWHRKHGLPDSVNNKCQYDLVVSIAWQDEQLVRELADLSNEDADVCLFGEGSYRPLVVYISTKVATAIRVWQTAGPQRLDPEAVPLDVRRQFAKALARVVRKKFAASDDERGTIEKAAMEGDEAAFNALIDLDIENV